MSVSWRRKNLKPEKSGRSRKGLYIPFQRVEGQLQINETSEIVPCRIFITDLNVYALGLFSTKPLYRGEKVTVTIEHPRHVFVRGWVESCIPHTLHKTILHQQEFEYRIRIRLAHATNDELTDVANYCREIYTPPEFF